MAEEISKKVGKRLTEKETAALLFFAALLFGIWLRLMPAASAGFPLNDGGMFYSMIRDLRSNGYALPAYTTYNKLNIPFVYSPLPFYLAGGLADLFHLPDLSVLLWLPALVNILTIPAFALLAGELLDSQLKTALATLLYALVPLSMDWFLMGGGLTRGLGQLFMILTCWSAIRLFRSKPWALALTIVCGALVILCHPESALLTVTSVSVIWLFSERKRQTLPFTLLAGAGVALVCSPWLVYVLRLHGTEPFLQALQTNGNALFLWAAIFPFNFTQENGLALLAVLGLIGFFVKLTHKEYLLPVWVVLPFFINPRSSSRAAILPLVILASATLLDVILPAMRSAAPSKSRNLAANLFPAYVVIYLLVGGYALDIRMAANHLSENDRQAMEWIKQNTPPTSQFIILSGETQLMRDPVQEWFPALTERRSQTTLQGWEWLAGDKFIHAIEGEQGLITCLQQDMACLKAETQKLGMAFDHVYIKKGAAVSGYYEGRILVETLENSGEYKKIFENSDIIVFGAR